MKGQHLKSRRRIFTMYGVHQTKTKNIWVCKEYNEITSANPIIFSIHKKYTYLTHKFYHTYQTYQKGKTKQKFLLKYIQ